MLLGPGILVVVVGSIIASFRWLWRRWRAHQIREEIFPFDEIPPNSDVARVILPGDEYGPLSDRLIPYSEGYFQQALAQWDKAWQEHLQSVAGLLENKAIALLCLGQKQEALSTLTQALRQWLPADVIDFALYDLLRTAPHPPDGVEEMIAMLKKGPS